MKQYSATPEDFVWFVCEQDWSKIQPNIYLLGSNAFLSQAEWYFSNKDSLNSMKGFLDTYKGILGVTIPKGLKELQAALNISNFCTECGITLPTFLNYVKGIKWRGSGIPYISFLSSPSFLEQSRTTFKRSASTNFQPTDYYLGFILSRLRTLPKRMSDVELEEYNWLIAETIFEPLQKALNNGANVQLRTLVEKALYQKHLPKFGSYVITAQGKFTPLAVYWICYAYTTNMERFTPSEFGDWKDIIKEYSDGSVKLTLLEE